MSTEKPEGKICLRGLVMDQMITLKRYENQLFLKVRAGYIWLKIGYSGRLL
jgi:hypothetical protein